MIRKKRKKMVQRKKERSINYTAFSLVVHRGEDSVYSVSLVF